jgi:hypothetical protein
MQVSTTVAGPPLAVPSAANARVPVLLCRVVSMFGRYCAWFRDALLM